MPCRVFSGKGQIFVVLEKIIKEVTVKEGQTIHLSPYLVVAFTAPSGTMPEIRNDVASFPAGCRLWHIKVDDMKRAMRLAKAKENEQCDDVGNTYPTVVRS
jgi:hypothetical protein